MKKRLGLLNGQDEGPQKASLISDWMKAKYKRAKLSAPDLVEGARAEVGSNSKASIDCLTLARSSSSSNSNRAVMRCLGKDNALPEPYVARVPMWDRKRACKTTGNMAFLPIHGVLDVIVPADKIQEYSSFAPDQTKFEENLQRTCDRLNVARDGVAALAFWGDFAKYYSRSRDSICLLEFRLLTGPCRKRRWICSFSKRVACQCGCSNRCTFDEFC